MIVQNPKLFQALKNVFPDIDDADLPTLRAGDGAWDSLAHLRLMMGLEAAFGRTIPPDAFDRLQSIEQIRDYIRTHWQLES